MTKCAKNCESTAKYAKTLESMIMCAKTQESVPKDDKYKKMWKNLKKESITKCAKTLGNRS